MSRVLVVCEYPTVNGGEASLLATLPSLSRTEFRITVACPPGGALADELNARGVSIEPFAEHSGGDRESRRADLAQIVDRTRPEILHANSLAMGRWTGPLAAEKGIPSICHLRDMLGLSAAAVQALNQHARLLAVSAAVRDYHADQGIRQDLTHVLRNGVDLTRFRPRAPTGWLTRGLGWPSDSIVIGAIGQLVARKGLDVLARAAAIVNDRVPLARYVIVGERYSTKDEAVEHERATRAAFEAAVGDRVRFLGRHSAIHELLPELTMLVHPARQEPLGRVLLEAAAAGLPIVATSVGGTPEIFHPESDAAILVPPGDPVELADAIERLAMDGALRAGLGQNARERMLEEFDADEAGLGLAWHYGETLKPRGA